MCDCCLLWFGRPALCRPSPTLRLAPALLNASLHVNSFTTCAEVLTGKGALQQLGFETGLPIGDLDGLILGVAAFNVLAALLPAKVSRAWRTIIVALGDYKRCKHH